MNDVGEAKKILGIDIIRSRQLGELFLTQKRYLHKVLERFGMEDSKSVNTPIAAHFKLSEDQSPTSEKEKREVQKTEYANMLGSLMYSMVCTRPDMAYALSIVSRYMANPGKEHVLALKWLMRYVKGSLNLGLLYRKSRDVEENAM